MIVKTDTHRTNLSSDRPGLTSHPSDVGAAAMAVTKARTIPADAGGKVLPHLVGGAAELDERAGMKRVAAEVQGEKSREFR